MKYIYRHWSGEKFMSKGERITNIGCGVIYSTNIKIRLGFRDFIFIELGICRKYYEVTRRGVTVEDSFKLTY